MFHLYLLESCGDGDDFLDGAAQSLDVIIPIKDLKTPTTEVLMSENQNAPVKACSAFCFITHSPDVQVVQAGQLQPLTKEVFLHAGLGLEDGQRNGSDGGEARVCQCRGFYFW